MSDEYSKFFECFCTRDEETVQTEDGHLCAQLHPKLIHEEVEGESLDLCFQYLGTPVKCPVLLAVQIAREVTDRILKDSISKLEHKSSASKQTTETGDGEKNADANNKNTFDGIDYNLLAEEVIKETKDVCTKWRKHLPSFVQQLSQKSCPFVSEHAIKNTRRKMEDRHTVMPYLIQLLGLKMPGNLRFYGVYDGHGGIEAAKYSSVHLHCHLAKGLRGGQTVVEAIKDAFFKTDELFVSHAKRENILSGSTVICAILEDYQCHIAWLGDSQAVLVRGGHPVSLMEPHKPEREDERKRIEDLGGQVVWFGAWRVNGNLSVSRAIGDASFKPYISAEPDVKTIMLEPSDDYLVVACDGLWDTLRKEDLVHEVQSHLQSGNERSTVAKRLTEVAKERGSSDNITVLVIFLRDGAVSSGDEVAVERDDTAAAAPKDKSRLSANMSQKGGSSTGSQRDVAGSEAREHGGVNERTENSHLAMVMGFLKDEVGVKVAQELVLENDSGELESSGDIQALSGDSTKNILNPLRIHSSDDTNGRDISDETDFEAVGYQSSPPSNDPGEKSHGSDDSLSHDSQLLEGQSDTSACDSAPHSHVGCSETPHRPRRRRHSGNRRSRKENRRPSYDKMKTATPPCIHSISVDRKQLDISFRESCRSLSQTSGHLLRMLSGFGVRSPTQRPSSSFRSTNRDRWTIAVEVEDWAAMFETNKPIETTQEMNLSTHW